MAARSVIKSFDYASIASKLPQEVKSDFARLVLTSSSLKQGYGRGAWADVCDIVRAILCSACVYACEACHKHLTVHIVRMLSSRHLFSCCVSHRCAACIISRCFSHY